jgi:hypothetical protein
MWAYKLFKWKQHCNHLLSDVFTAAKTTTASLKTETLNEINQMHHIYDNSRGQCTGIMVITV